MATARIFDVMCNKLSRKHLSTYVESETETKRKKTKPSPSVIRIIAYAVFNSSVADLLCALHDSCLMC
jgi:hypothetical protein